MPRSCAIVVLALLVSSGCTGLRGTSRVFDSSDLQATPAGRAQWVSSWPQALATVLDVFERRLNFPRLRVQMVLAPDQRSFEEVLLEQGYAPTLARDTAVAMRAVGGHELILINEGRLTGDAWPQRVALLAHELTHVLQYAVTGGRRGTSDQWLREGFATWVEARALDALGDVDASRVFTETFARVRDLGPDRLPPLVELATFPDWLAHNRGRRPGELYLQALAAVTLLIERHGANQVFHYFARFATREDRAENFREAFGPGGLEAFDREFRESLRE